MNKARILVVDDDAKLSSLLRVILERLGGYCVQEENRSFAAIAAAEAFRPHLIILDVNMPGKDGGDIATALRAHPVLSKTPFIFLTSLVAANEAGVHGGVRYLAKPVDPKNLMSVVSMLVPPLAA